MNVEINRFLSSGGYECIETYTENTNVLHTVELAVLKHIKLLCLCIDTIGNGGKVLRELTFIGVV